jgi:uncharacterized membrane protein YkoI
MLMKKILLNPLIALSLLLSVSSTVDAAKDDSKKSKQPPKYECQLISRADAIAQAKRKNDGKIVGVQFSDRGSRSVYKVRMLIDKKRVKTLSINACR